MKQNLLKTWLVMLCMLVGIGSAWATDVTWTASSAGYDNQAEVSNVDVNSNISLTFDKGTNSNAPKYYTSGTAVRAYGGNTIAVTATNATITGVTFTFGSNDGSNAITANVGTFKSPNWSGSANAVTFTIGGTTGNRRISAIKVTYTTSGGGSGTTKYAVTANTDLMENGSVSADKSSAAVGETVTLTATPNEGYQVDQWYLTNDYGNDGKFTTTSLSDTQISFVMKDFNMKYYATFKSSTPAKTLDALTVSGTPTKTEYYAGDAFETAGLVVTGTYSDGTTATITDGIEWTVDPETLALGTTSVNVIAGVGEVVSEIYTIEGLTVTKPDFETATYEFSSFDSAKEVELTDLDGFVITLNGNGGTNPAWNSNQARVYAKGSLTVKANNAIIKSIEYDYTVNANKKGIVPTIDGVEGTTDAGTWYVENKTWTGADNEVTFSTSGTAGNIGFTKLIIKYVESTNTVAVTVNACGNASFSCGKALDFTNADVKAYMVTGETESSVTLTEIQKVPANTGVFIIGEGGSYNIPVLDGDADDTSANKLIATTEPKAVTASDNIWALSKTDGMLHHVSSGTIGAGKAYFVSTISGSSSAKSIVFNDEITGISNVAVKQNMDNNVYNLAGQRVNANTKGFIIVNGKKFINK